MRNWSKTLRPASFRGVAFKVDEAALPKTGRRVVEHLYVKAETHGTEDMGRLPREFRIRAYIAEDQADSLCAQLVEACSTAGASELVLPFFGSNRVRATGCGPSIRKELLGYVAIDLDFIEAGQDGAGFPALPIGDRLAAGALDGLAGAVSDVLSSFPVGIGGGIGPVGFDVGPGGIGVGVSLGGMSLSDEIAL